MSAPALKFVALSDAERSQIDRTPAFDEEDQVELRVRHVGGMDEMMILPFEAAELVRDAVERLRRGQSVAIVDREADVGLDDAALILGLAPPLLLLRVERGDIASSIVEGQRRVALRDLLGFKRGLDAQKIALDALARDTEDLMANHGL